jgi:putative membrane protein
MKIENYKYAGIGLLWLMHVSAFIGINSGFEDFFLPLSAINLWYISLLLIWFYPIRNRKNVLLFVIIAVLGYLAEVIGVATGQVFGEYSYGENLGFKVFGVPVIIGVNWAVLSFVCTGLTGYFSIKSNYIKAGLASAFMLLFDFFIEQSAPIFDFWTFKAPNVPLQNYITWFVLAYIFNFSVLQLNKEGEKEGNKDICLNIYLLQILFFIAFYVF